MSKHRITNFGITDVTIGYDRYLERNMAYVHLRGTYRGEAFRQHTTVSPELYEEVKTWIIVNAYREALEFVTEEERHGYFDETDKKTD